MQIIKQVLFKPNESILSFLNFNIIFISKLPHGMKKIEKRQLTWTLEHFCLVSMQAFNYHVINDSVEAKN
jgi:hypothetical protein